MTTSAATLAALDWNELTARLAAAADSPAGRALCLALPLAADAREARKRMAAVAELATILRTGEAPPRLEAPQIDAALASAEKAVVLGAEELRPVGVLVGAGRAGAAVLSARLAGAGARDRGAGARSGPAAGRWRARSTTRSTPRARSAIRRRPSSSGCAPSATACRSGRAARSRS